MSCLQTLAGIAKDCASNLAGIAKVWIMNFDAVTATIATNQLTALNAVDSSSDLEDVCFAYNFRKQTATLTSTQTKDNASGTAFWTNVLALQFSKMETTKHLEVSAITQGELAVIAKDNNGKYWYIGAKYAVESTDATAQSGQNYGDLNGYNITLQQISDSLPVEISATATTGASDVLIEVLESL